MQEFDIPDYLPGDALEFVLMQSHFNPCCGNGASHFLEPAFACSLTREVDPQSGEEILGMALLSDAQFGNFGYNAELTLACPGAANSIVLCHLAHCAVSGS
eukprot:1430025-Amphidinium_carterae.1